MRVVIAEDLALLRDGMIRLLRDHGHEVVAAVEDGDALVRAVAGTSRTSPSWTCGCRPTSPTRACRRRWRRASGCPETADPDRLPVRRGDVRRRAAGRRPRRRRLPAEGPRRRRARVRGGGRARRRRRHGDRPRGRRAAAHAPPPRRRPLDELTPREREVLELMAEGRSNGAIAAALVVTEAPSRSTSPPSSASSACRRRTPTTAACWRCWRTCGLTGPPPTRSAGGRMVSPCAEYQAPLRRGGRPPGEPQGIRSSDEPAATAAPPTHSSPLPARAARARRRAIHPAAPAPRARLGALRARDRTPCRRKRRSRPVRRGARAQRRRLRAERGDLAGGAFVGPAGVADGDLGGGVDRVEPDVRRRSRRACGAATTSASVSASSVRSEKTTSAPIAPVSASNGSRRLGRAVGEVERLGGAGAVDAQQAVGRLDRQAARGAEALAEAVERVGGPARQRQLVRAALRRPCGRAS